MKFSLLTLLPSILLCWSIISPSHSAPSPDFTTSNDEKIAQIKSLLQSFRLLNSMPGLGATVIQNSEQNGNLVFAEGFGLRDREFGLEADNKTLFSVGSNSKGFSSTLFVKVLHEKFPELGEQVMDTPISKLAPDFEFVLSDRFRSEFLTFRDILSMRVCLEEIALNEMFVASPTKEDFYYRLRYQKEGCGVRNGFAYSNALYGLAGEIVAHLSNKTVQQLVSDYMGELGFTDSTFFDEAGEYETLPNISKGYYKRLGVIRQFNNRMLRKVSAVLTAGAILMSQEDMVKYINLHLNKGKIDGRQIIPEEVFAWVYRNSNPFGDKLGRTKEDEQATGSYGYAFGYMLGLHDGYFSVSHGGYYPPYNSRLTLFPDLNIGIFTVSNGPGVTGMETGITHELIHERIYDILTKPSEASSKLEAKQPLDSMEEFSKTMGQALTSPTQAQPPIMPSLEFSDEDVQGLYGTADSGEFVVSTNGTNLLFRYGEWGQGILERTNASSFSIQWTSDFMHNFYTYGDLFRPEFGLQFQTKDEVLFMGGSDLMGWSYFPYIRNATIDTFPRIPWEENSCGPTTLN